MRKYFDNDISIPMSFEVGGEVFNYRNTTLYAAIADMSADIHFEIRQTQDGRFVRLTVTALDESHHLDGFGIRKGWYVARWLTPEDATRERASWAMLREQPSEPPSMRR